MASEPAGEKIASRVHDGRRQVIRQRHYTLLVSLAAHTLRHRFATTAYAATHDLFVVAELLGHESVETTEHYVAMPDGRLREATAAVRLI